MSALEVYLTQFYDNPTKIEEFKINFLKNHYYDNINQIMNVAAKDFQIGVTKNRNLIYFISKIDNSYEIVYNHKTSEYFKKYKNKPNLHQINLSDYEIKN